MVAQQCVDRGAGGLFQGLIPSACLVPWSLPFSCIIFVKLSLFRTCFFILMSIFFQNLDIRVLQGLLDIRVLRGLLAGRYVYAKEYART